MQKDLKLLYVDDEEINRFIFETKMRDKFKVFIADSGENALELLKENTEITHVVSDMRMPGLSGIDFIKEAQENFSDKKYFILSGYNLNKEIEEALETGLIDDFWTKPAEFDKIEAALIS